MASQFMGVLAVLAAIFNSGIIQALIQAIEKIYKASTGVEKKEAAMKMLTPLVPAGGAPIVSAAIDTQVQAFNEEGVFKHAGEPGNSKAGDPGPGLVIDSFAR